MAENIIEQAKQLGSLLKESEEFKALQQKEMIMLQDADAKKALGEHQQARESLQMKQMQGQQLDQEEIDAFKALESKMVEMNSVKDFNEAREKFEALLNNVNQTINNTLLGQQNETNCSCSSGSCAPSNGCSPGGGCDY